MESKHIFKAGANADAGAQKFYRYVAGGRNDEGPEFGGEIETRDPRAVILAFLSRKPRPAQGGRDCEKLLTETAAVATHCVFLLTPAGSSRRHKEDESIGQLSVCIKQCRSHFVVQYSITTYHLRKQE